MKKFILVIFVLMAFSCNDDKILQDKIAKLEQKIAELESIPNDTVFVQDKNAIDSINIFWQNKIIDINFASNNKIDSLNSKINELEKYISSIEIKSNIQLIPDTVSDNFHYKNNIPMQLIDGKLETRWLSDSFGQIACFDFGEVVYIDSIYIATYKNLPTKIRVNNIEEGKFDTLLTERKLWSGFKLKYTNQLFYFETISSENNWSDISEVYFKGWQLLTKKLKNENNN